MNCFFEEFFKDFVHDEANAIFENILQYESSIPSGVGGSDFSALVNAKYVTIYLVSCCVRSFLVAE
jgi:hypothetical protein